jgi:hypothetical protein
MNSSIQSRGRNTISSGALRTIIRPAGDDPDTFEIDDQETPNCTAMNAPDEMPEIELSFEAANRTPYLLMEIFGPNAAERVRQHQVENDVASIYAD